LQAKRDFLQFLPFFCIFCNTPLTQKSKICRPADDFLQNMPVFCTLFAFSAEIRGFLQIFCNSSDGFLQKTPIFCRKRKKALWVICTFGVILFFLNSLIYNLYTPTTRIPK